jgi:putative ribosome biogenesis GTPase RsgA
MTTIDILKASARELQQRADEHQRLLSAAIEENDIRRMLDSCHLSDCPHRHELKNTLLEAISVLEETRKAFKSKQLETLRKKMIQVLAEES